MWGAWRAAWWAHSPAAQVMMMMMMVTAMPIYLVRVGLGREVVNTNVPEQYKYIHHRHNRILGVLVLVGASFCSCAGLPTCGSWAHALG